MTDSDGWSHDALFGDDAETLYDRAPCGYLSTDADGTITKVNRTFLVLTGHTRDELVGRRRFVDLLSIGGQIFHETHYAPMLKMQGSAREVAFDLVRTDGERVPVLVTALLEASPTDEHQGVVRVAIFDATQRREYERELLRAKERAEQSDEHARQLARTLQQTLIPPTAPVIPGVDVAGVYRPAGAGDEVGGDFYDVFQISDDEWCVTLGDVRGKGVEAAVVTALVRYALRAAVMQVRSPTAALRIVNDVLRQAEDTDRFCSVLLLRVRPGAESVEVTLAAGGHSLPLLVPAAGSNVDEVGVPGTLIGLFADPPLIDTTMTLSPGDALVAFTDGVTEARTSDDLFGDARLVRSLLAHRGSATQLVTGTLADVMAFQDDDPRDDIALVALRLPAQPAG